MQQLASVSTISRESKQAGDDISSGWLTAMFNPEPLASLQHAWLEAATRAVKLPLSGDVTQWIRAWGEAIGQVGLVNVNYGGSRDIHAERRITGRYSYGSQLGRVIEVLAPYVKNHPDAFGGQDSKAVGEFLEMAEEIARLKETSVEDLLERVKQWKKTGSFRAKLQRLREGLDRLEAGD